LNQDKHFHILSKNITIFSEWF